MASLKTAANVVASRFHATVRDRLQPVGAQVRHRALDSLCTWLRDVCLCILLVRPASNLIARLSKAELEAILIPQEADLG